MIAFRGFSYRYPDAEGRALDDVDVEIAAGEIVLLVGESGCGKSTLLRACCGLVPHYFGGEAWGDARVAGLDLRGNGPAELAGRIGYCAQEPETQVVSATVRAELELPLELAGSDPVTRARAVEEVSLALAIEHLLERTTGTLSGGELQRVALGASLVARPEAVVLDEPTSQLDPVAGDELLGLLRRINEQWGIGIVIAEHRVERCLPFADRVVVLDRGRIALDAPPARFLEWAAGSGSPLATPSAELCDRLGIRPLPVTLREARRALAPLKPDRGQSPAGGQSPSGDGEPIAGRPPLLAARDLQLVAGEGEVEVLRGVSAEIGAGERVALMGRNGAGKTTLLRALAGRTEPATGVVERNGPCALLPQWPGDLIVAERVAGEFLAGADSADLARAGLADLADRDPRDISGGERQRLAVAIAMAGLDPAHTVLLLDEPTLGLDRRRKRELRAWLREMSDQGSAILVATHDTEFAAELCDRVVLLGDGGIVADGPAGEVLSGGWYFSTEIARAVDLPGVATLDAALAALSGNSVRLGGPVRGLSPGVGGHGEEVRS